MTTLSAPIDSSQVERILAKLAHLKSEITELESECIALLSSSSEDDALTSSLQELELPADSSSENESSQTDADTRTQKHLSVLASRHKQVHAEFVTVSDEAPGAAGIVARLAAYAQDMRENKNCVQESTSNDTYFGEAIQVLSGRHVLQLEKDNTEQLAEVITLSTRSRERASTQLITLNNGIQKNNRVGYLKHAIAASIIAVMIFGTALTGAYWVSHNAGYVVGMHLSKRIQQSGVDLQIAPRVAQKVL